MSATSPVITIAVVVKWEAPDGDVRLSDGGIVDHATERYDALHDVFGTVASWPEFAAQKGDMAESATLKLAPNPSAALGDWWRKDLEGTRLRFWMGDVDSDHVTLTNSERLADTLVDTVGREQAPDGSDLLVLDLAPRTERFFLTDEGNVCSDRQHQTAWPGETGFANCTDVAGKFAWGAPNASSENVEKGAGKKKDKKGKGQ